MLKVLFVLLSTALAHPLAQTNAYTDTCPNIQAQLLLAPPDTFDVWASKNGKFYAPTERDYRQTIYEQNIAKHSSYRMENNQFADLTEKEVAIKHSTYKKPYQALRGSVAAS